MKRLTLGAAASFSAFLIAPAWAASGEASFTPTSFVMPIRGILLAKARVGTGFDNAAAIYECNPTAAASNGDAGPAQADAGATHDCTVDMADAAQLASLFSEPANIQPGTYDSIVVMTCVETNSFVAKVKGSVQVGADTYYTTSGYPVISTDAAELDYTSINYAGCASTVKIAPPVTIAEGDSITVSAFFTLQNLSWVLGNNSPGLGGCAVAPQGVSNVCSGLPVLVGYLGTAVPTLDAYYISQTPGDVTAANAAGQVMLLSAGGEPFAGFLRRVYSQNSETPSVSYDVPLRLIQKNSLSLLDAGAPPADAAAGDAAVVDTYNIEAIGDPAQDETKYRVRFPSFELRDHVGTLFLANGTGSVGYHAVKH